MTYISDNALIHGHAGISSDAALQGALSVSESNNVITNAAGIQAAAKQRYIECNNAAAKAYDEYEPSASVLKRLALAIQLRWWLTRQKIRLTLWMLTAALKLRRQRREAQERL